MQGELYSPSAQRIERFAPDPNLSKGYEAPNHSFLPPKMTRGVARLTALLLLYLLHGTGGRSDDELPDAYAPWWSLDSACRSSPIAHVAPPMRAWTSSDRRVVLNVTAGMQLRARDLTVEHEHTAIARVRFELVFRDAQPAGAACHTALRVTASADDGSLVAARVTARDGPRG